MKILAIESSCSVASAAAAEDGRLLAHYYADGALTHSVKLMPMIDGVLNSAGVDISEIDVFAVSEGPGSFTGIRIGMATAEGLAKGGGKPVVGVSSLEAAAYNCLSCADTVYAMTDARGGQAFFAAYKSENGVMVCVKEPRVGIIDEIILSAEKNALFCGDAVLKNPEKFEKTKTAPFHMNMPNAAALAYAAFEKIKTEGYTGASPVYLRKSQAEREKERICEK